MGQEPSREDGDTIQENPPRKSLARDEEDFPVRDVPRHREKDEAGAVDCGFSETRLDLSTGEDEQDRQSATDMVGTEGELQELPITGTITLDSERPETPPTKLSSGSSNHTPITSPGTPPNAPIPASPPLPKDMKIAIDDEAPKKRSTKNRFLLLGFIAGLLLGPFALLLVLWKRVRERRGSVLLLSIGVLLAALVWVIVIVICVSVLV